MKDSDVLFYAGSDHASARGRADQVALRKAARQTLEAISLVARCATGDRPAVEAMHVGFWPFVRDFERAIDRHAFPTRTLAARFGPGARDRIRAIAGECRAMREEEDAHSRHWQDDAVSLGLATLESSVQVSGVQELIHLAASREHSRFFAVLAGTEFMAEELGAILTAAPPFTSLFARGRWVWGDIHIAPHPHGPSHLEIDLDLARATSSHPDDANLVEAMVLETIATFGRAAAEVESQLAPTSRRVEFEPVANRVAVGGAERNGRGVQATLD